jgi:hypothetical protein
MLPLSLFRDRRLSVGASVITTAFFVMFGLFFLFAQYLQFVRGYSPLHAGLATLPLAGALILIAPRSATMTDRFGSGPVISTGFALVAGGMGVLGLTGTGTTYLVIAAAMVLLGAGMSLIAAPSTGSIMTAVPQAKAGVGSAINDTTREVGGALGIAVMGSLAAAAYRSALDLKDAGVTPAVAKAAKESVGAAATLASQVPGGAALASRAGDAFTHAFHVSSLAVGAVCLVAAAVVAKVFSRQAESVAAGEPRPEPEPDFEPELTPAPEWLAG